MTEVHVAGLSYPLAYPGTVDDFRKLQPDHAGALRWADGAGGHVLLDTNVAPVVALRELPYSRLGAGTVRDGQVTLP